MVNVHTYTHTLVTPGEVQGPAAVAYLLKRGHAALGNALWEAARGSRDQSSLRRCVEPPRVRGPWGVVISSLVLMGVLWF